MKKLRFKFHWSFILLAIGLCYFGKAQVFLCYFLAVVLHELGHYIVAKKLGYELNIISLMPYGASLSGKNQDIKNNHEIYIALAGPCVNIILCFFCLLISLFGNLKIINIFLSANLSTLVFNILPIFPLDGGRILLSLFSINSSRVKAHKKVTIIGYFICAFFVCLFIFSYFYSLNYMLGINSLFLIISATEESNDNYYKKLSDLQQEKNILKTKKQKKYKVNEYKTVFDTYKLIDKSCFCKIMILDNFKNVKKIINENQLKSKLFESKYSFTLKECFCE